MNEVGSAVPAIYAKLDELTRESSLEVEITLRVQYLFPPGSPKGWGLYVSSMIGRMEE